MLNRHNRLYHSNSSISVDAHSDAIDVLPNSHTENCNDEFESNNYIDTDIISNSMEVADSLTVTQFASLDTSVVQCVKSTASQSFFPV